MADLDQNALEAAMEQSSANGGWIHRPTIVAAIEAYLSAPEMGAKPVAFDGIAKRKLDGLLAQGWSIAGYAISKNQSYGLVTSGAFVGWFTTAETNAANAERKVGELTDTVAQLTCERDEARAMVERLLEAGKKDLILMEKTGSTMVSLRQRAEAAEADNARLRAENEANAELVKFVARWAWDKDGNGTSDAERFSVIKFHPAIKAASARTAMEDRHGE